MKDWKSWLLAVLAAGALALAWLGPLDQLAEDQAQAGLKRALTTFAAARALNGIISVAQGTELAIEPAGVGVTFAPGQVLDPVNDLIEQFSALMLTASVSFGVQSALIGIGGHWLLSALLTLAILAWWLRRHFGPDLSGTWLTRAVAVLLLLRFALPAAALGSDTAFRFFLADRYQQSQAALTLSGDELGELAQPAPTAADSSMTARWQSWWSQAGDAIDVGKRLERLKDSAARVTEHVVELIVVFLLQTLIMPILLLFALWRGGLAMLRSSD
jgi:hypothetical protein